MDAWKPVLSFDHSATRFPLTGEHTNVACEGCHRQDAAVPKRVTATASASPRRGAAGTAKATLETRTFGGIPFGDCDACHKDPHTGSFKFSCFQCHKTTGWFDLKGDTPFTHSTTGFELKGAHAVVSCKDCHTSANFRQPVAHEQCLDCHQDPHEGQFLARVKGECASCHNETSFRPSQFDVSMHRETGFPLVGKHATVECAQCHPGEKAAADFHPAFEACADCHEDAHQGQLAEAPWKNDCSRCHTADGFAPSLISLQEHRQWEFPLEGAHRAVPCGECHAKSTQPPKVVAANVRVESNWAFHPQAQQCRDCHTDPHGFEAGAMVRSGGAPDCSECHAVSGWNTTRPFDHQRTAFALKGAHRTVSCLQCHHVAGNLTANLRLAFHEAPKSCAECHEDVHSRQFVAPTGEVNCESCHAEERWKPSKFDHERQSTFSLVGAHQEVPCRQCHTRVETRDERPILIYAGVPRGCAECHQ
jgi:hypothetical protein